MDEEEVETSKSVSNNKNSNVEGLTSKISEKIVVDRFVLVFMGVTLFLIVFVISITLIILKYFSIKYINSKSKKEKKLKIK